ncbi:hypothetical protein [Methylomonas sp. YC3]
MRRILACHPRRQPLKYPPAPGGHRSSKNHLFANLLICLATGTASLLFISKQQIENHRTSGLEI